MKYHYDPSEMSRQGCYRCNECSKYFTAGNQNCKCDKEDITFVFGKQVIQFAIDRSAMTGSDSAIIYGGLTLNYIKKHFPQGLVGT